MAMMVCMVATLFSCNKDEEKAAFAEVDILGSWTISSSELKINGVSDSGLSSFYSEGYTVEAKGDKTYEISKEDVTYEDGKWSFDGKRTFVMTDDEGNATSFQIQSYKQRSI